MQRARIEGLVGPMNSPVHDCINQLFLCPPAGTSGLETNIDRPRASWPSSGWQCHAAADAILDCRGPLPSGVVGIVTNIIITSSTSASPSPHLERLPSGLLHVPPHAQLVQLLAQVAVLHQQLAGLGLQLLHLQRQARLIGGSTDQTWARRGG